MQKICRKDEIFTQKTCKKHAKALISSFLKDGDNIVDTIFDEGRIGCYIIRFLAKNRKIAKNLIFLLHKKTSHEGRHTYIYSLYYPRIFSVEFLYFLISRNRSLCACFCYSHIGYFVCKIHCSLVIFAVGNSKCNCGCK